MSDVNTSPSNGGGVDGAPGGNPDEAATPTTSDATPTGVVPTVSEETGTSGGDNGGSLPSADGSATANPSSNSDGSSSPPNPDGNTSGGD